jgi:hypothetical protein
MVASAANRSIDTGAELAPGERIPSTLLFRRVCSGFKELHQIS